MDWLSLTNPGSKLISRITTDDIALYSYCVCCHVQPTQHELDLLINFVILVPEGVSYPGCRQFIPFRD